MALDHLTHDALMRELALRPMSFLQIHTWLGRRVVGANFDPYREADRWLQKQRRAGMLEFERGKRPPIWRLTDKAAHSLATAKEG